ncbi:MAG: [FeFe] hydrogenase H-cluster radical SAM maturase HydG [Clostridia bacterium]|nr:[FeFe] hydrogenase H-cluster radical SAM maturase HydG [Clostridia bacterium]
MIDIKLFAELLAKARNLEGLQSEEAAYLLDVQDPLLQEEIFLAAKEVKEKVYGSRIVFFAPLYLTNECDNDCLYCGFRRDNKLLERKTLSIDEVKMEVRLLVAEGHKRILLVAGEDFGAYPITSLVETIEIIYQTSDIRRINVNIAPMTVDKYKLLKGAGIGTYQLFQETYHGKTYAKMHPTGPKKDFDWRYTAIDRAMEAGIDDVGIGVLFGLFDPRFEVQALIRHCRDLEERWGVGPHTISVPRLKRAQGMKLESIPHPIDDQLFKVIVAVLRLAVPYTGIILSTREGAELRDELLHLGVSQLSAGSHPGPGGYHDRQNAGQFSIGDERTLAEMVHSVVGAGYLPSFCTACYRKSRIGKSFMDLAKTGVIGGKCLPNALITFNEYLHDYAVAGLREKGKELIEQEMGKMLPGDEAIVRNTLEELEKGKRDFPV